MYELSDEEKSASSKNLFPVKPGSMTYLYAELSLPFELIYTKVKQGLENDWT